MCILDGNTYSWSARCGHVSKLVNVGSRATPTKASILTGDPTEVARSHWYGTYAQDSWRVTNKVTLNLGLRWEYFGALSVRNNYWGNFNPNASQHHYSSFPAIWSGRTAPFRYISPKFVIFRRELVSLGMILAMARPWFAREGACLETEPSRSRSSGASAPFGATFFGGTAANPVLIGPEQQWNGGKRSQFRHCFALLFDSQYVQQCCHLCCWSIQLESGGSCVSKRWRLEDQWDHLHRTNLRADGRWHRALRRCCGGPQLP